MTDETELTADPLPQPGADEAPASPPVEAPIEEAKAAAGPPLDWVGEPLINVNVYSARFVDPDNILNCGLVDGSVAALSAAEQTISCTLLGE